MFPIHLPPLRERAEDVPLIAEHFLDQIGEREGAAKRFAPRGARSAWPTYRWPGNVRELRNVVYRAYVMTPGDDDRTTTACPTSAGAAVGRRPRADAHRSGSARRSPRSSGS